MKKIITLIVAVAIAALVTAGTAQAWHASVSRDCDGIVTITQSSNPGAFIVSDDGSTVVIGWQGSSETQKFYNVTKPENCVTPPPPPPPPGPPPVCPDGLPPTQGEDAYNPNDDCARPPKAPPLVITTPLPPPPPAATPPPPPPVKPKPEPRPKPKPPTQVCVALSVSTKSILADGKVDTIRVKTKPGAIVRLRGLAESRKRADRNGVAVFKVNPTKKGIILVSTEGNCEPFYIGVTPPTVTTVTG